MDTRTVLQIAVHSKGGYTVFERRLPQSRESGARTGNGAGCKVWMWILVGVCGNPARKAPRPSERAHLILPLSSKDPRTSSGPRCGSSGLVAVSRSWLCTGPRGAVVKPFGDRPHPCGSRSGRRSIPRTSARRCSFRRFDPDTTCTGVRWDPNAPHTFYSTFNARIGART